MGPLRRECSEKFENEIDDPLAETLKPISIVKPIAIAPLSRWDITKIGSENRGAITFPFVNRLNSSQATSESKSYWHFPSCRA